MEHIIVNLPRTQEDFNSGNGEGCWVLVEKEVKEQHDADYNGGLFEGILDNDSFYYPELISGETVRFTMRGEYRPVALVEGFLDQYKAISDEEFNTLIRKINEAKADTD